MIKVLTCEQMKKADSYTINKLGVPSKTLMERAGEKVSQVALGVLDNLQNKKVLVVCGSGNNGGDGYTIARILSLKGYYVSVYQVDKAKSKECVEASKEYLGQVFDKLNFENDFGLIIDCIYGTGFHGEPDEKGKKAINFINNSNAFVISCDIPSGLNGDNGKCTIAVRANLTVAIGALKLGHILNDGRDFCGNIKVEDIGIKLPEDNYTTVYQEENFAACFNPRKSNSHKGTYGKVCVIGGSEYYSGAPLMSISALKAGCGYLQVCVPDCIFPYFIGKYPEVILSKMSSKNGIFDFDKNSVKVLKEIANSYDAIAIGMGCCVNKEIYKIVAYLLKHFKGTLIVDADALNSISSNKVNVLKKKKCKVIITPHVREFSRITKKRVEEIVANPISIARDFAKKYGVTVMLKSNSVIITDGENTTINIDGTPALSKGGSGDVLAGLVASICARREDILLNCSCAMYVLGKSAQSLAQTLSDYGVCASDIILEIPKIINKLSSI